MKKWFVPNAPHVDWLPMTFLKKDLRCCVAKRAGEVMELFLGSVEMFRTARRGVSFSSGGTTTWQLTCQSPR